MYARLFVYLQIIGSTTSSGAGDPSSAISSVASTVDALLIAIISALVGMVLLLWVGGKLFASIVQIIRSHLPWIPLGGLEGDAMHKSANKAIFKLLIEAPFIIFIAVLVGHLVQGITGFSIPLEIPNLSSLGH
jgi:hypothetical protein